MEQSELLAYVVGVALGDGNLSCPNGKATRLRITCDIKYPNLIKDITIALQALFPHNKVSHIARTDNCLDISVYSNQLNDCMPWKVGSGPKYNQKARVPDWILKDDTFIKSCVRGLIQTDGSIYTDRVYKMVNFNNMTEELVDDVYYMISRLGYTPQKYQAAQKHYTIKYSVRLSRNVDSFLQEVCLHKS